MKTIKIITAVLLSILVVILLFIKPVDSEKFDYSHFLETSKINIEKTISEEYLKDTSQLKSAWTKENITPNFKVRMVGYGIRGDFKSVHDSLFVRTILLSTRHKTYAIISYDILIVSPIIVKAVEQKFSENNIHLDGIYYSASHSHSSFGGWSDKLMGYLILGGYDKQIVEQIANATLSTVKKASKDLKKTKTGFQKYNIPRLVSNRLSHQLPYDAWIRIIKFLRDDGSTALLSTFQAHPTTLTNKISSLSGEYPGELCSQLEKNKTVGFAMFCAGAVASHSEYLEQIPVDVDELKYAGFVVPYKKNYIRFFLDLKLYTENKIIKYDLPYFNDLNRYVDSLTKYTTICYNQIKISETNKLNFAKIPIELKSTSMRLNKYVQLRDWAFDAIIGKQSASITALRIGDVVLLGTPCDFSGQFYADIDSLCQKRKIIPVLTSFNGDYIGYITPDKYFDLDNSEVVEMNWYGYGSGSYMLEIIKQIIEKI